MAQFMFFHHSGFSITLYGLPPQSDKRINRAIRVTRSAAEKFDALPRDKQTSSAFHTLVVVAAYDVLYRGL